MQPINRELNRIRKQTKMTVKESKFILLKNSDDLTDEEKTKLGSILNHSQRLRKAYEFKEEFRKIFETHQTPEEGQVEILRWLKKAQAVYCE
ncbi:MAG: transposase, partial [Cyanobacteriota bacterium]